MDVEAHVVQPSEQATHSLAPAVEYVPASQFVQDVALSELYVPARQDVHVV